MTFEFDYYNKHRAESKFISYQQKNPNKIDDEIISKIEASPNAPLREKILAIKDSIPETDSQYEFDLPFALKFYELMNSESEFNETIASNYDFWRGLCLDVVPDIVFNRHHGFQPDYFYKKDNRIYLSTMWWYIQLSYQGDIEATFEVLQPLTTDYIMQLVDRASKNGVYLATTRLIMKDLALVPTKIRTEQKNGQNLFRRIMMQDVARRENYNLLFEDENQTYVDELFEACGVNLNEYK